MSDKSTPSVLFLVGMPGAGKSSCVAHLETKGIPSVYFGGVVVDETKRRNNGKTSEALEKVVRMELRRDEGMEAIALRMIPRIDELLKTHERVVADGLYSWSEYKVLKNHYGDQALVLALTAPRHIRHERLARRPVRPLTPAEASAREYAEIENLEKGGPIANADYTVNNDADPLTMLQDLDRILYEIGFLTEPT
jgi:dephospho-CoA kinase